jgi:hypothetical protein
VCGLDDEWFDLFTNFSINLHTLGSDSLKQTIAYAFSLVVLVAKFQDVDAVRCPLLHEFWGLAATTAAAADVPRNFHLSTKLPRLNYVVW